MNNDLDTLYKEIQADRRIAAAVKQLEPIDALTVLAKEGNVKYAHATLTILVNGIHNNTRPAVEALHDLSFLNAEVQLRVLQQLPLVIKDIPDEEVPTILEIPARLLGPGMVGSIATATLQQLLVMVFETRQVAAKRIYQDLCDAYHGHDTTYIEVKLDKAFILEILGSIDVDATDFLVELLNETDPLLRIKIMRIIMRLLPENLKLLCILDKPDVPALEVIYHCLDTLPDTELPRIVEVLLTFEDQLPLIGTYETCSPPIRVNEVTIDGLIYSERSESGLGEWLRPKRRLSHPTHPAYIFLLVLDITRKLSKRPNSIWRALLTLHSAFLSASLSSQLEEDILQSVEDTILQLDHQSRNVYLRRLGRIATNSSLDNTELSQRSFSCIATFLSVIRQLRNTLDRDAWLQILSIMQSAELALVQGRRKSDMMSPVTSSDVSRLTIDLAEFFSCDDLSDSAFSSLIDALCSLRLGASSPALYSPLERPNPFSPGPSSDFSLNKLKILLPANTTRFVTTAASDVLLQHLAVEVRSGSIAAAELISMLTVQAVQLGLSAEHQHKFVDAIGLLIGSETIQLIQLQTLITVLETLGYDLICGWDLIMKALHDAAKSSNEVVKLGYISLELICNNYLSKVDMTGLLKTVVAFATQTVSFTTALSAVSLFWGILDFLPIDEDFPCVYVHFSDHLWLRYMQGVIATAQDERHEVRNSAIQVCFRLLERLEEMGNNAWLTAINLVLLELQKLPLEGESMNTITIGTSEVLQNDAIPYDVHQALFNHFQVALFDAKGATTAWKEFKVILTTSQHGYHATIFEKPLPAGLSQDTLTTYIECAALVNPIPMIRFDEVLRYNSSEMYYLDIDYPSNVQKAVLATSVYNPAWLILPMTKIEYNIRPSNGKWKGIPTFVALTRDLIHRASDHFCLPYLQRLVDARFTHASISSDKVHLLWQQATTQIIAINQTNPSWASLLTLIGTLLSPTDSEEFTQLSLNAISKIMVNAPDGQMSTYAELLAHHSQSARSTLIREWCLLELLRMSTHESVLPFTIMRTKSGLRDSGPELDILIDHLGDDIIHASHRALLKAVFEDVVNLLLSTDDERKINRIREILSRVVGYL